MALSKENFQEFQQKLLAKNVTLVAVSKIQPLQKILKLYEFGQRDFGENYVQELLEKHEQLPKDIKWHFIGHLQSNKVKFIAPFVHLIHGVDSFKLLKEINKQGDKHQRIIDVLLQVHIATEETKFGLDATELQDIMHQMEVQPLKNVNIKGLMGMASFSDDVAMVRKEFRKLKQLFDMLYQNHPDFKILSMGMSGDYEIAIEEGSNMVRIGSLLFGARI